MSLVGQRVKKILFADVENVAENLFHEDSFVDAFVIIIVISAVIS